MAKKRDRIKKQAARAAAKKVAKPLTQPAGWRDRVIGLLPPALLIGLQIGLFSVWQIYAGNQSEFDHGLLDMTPLFLLVAGLIAVALILVPLVLPKTSHHRVVALGTAAAILFFIQSTFLVWNYGVFDGGAVKWEPHAEKGWLELALWVGLLTAAYFRPRFWVKQSVFACGLLIVLQFGLLTATSLGKEEGFWHREGSFADSPPLEIYDYSVNQNVVHVLLDAFQTDVFEELVAEEKLTEKLEGFTLYRDNVSVSAHTAFAIPALFSGEIYRGVESPSTYYNRSINELGFPNRLHDAGYRVNLLPRLMMFKSNHDYHFRVPNTFGGSRGFRQRQAAWQLLDVGLFRQFPHVLKKPIYNQGQWRLSGLLSTPPTHRSIHQRAFMQDYIDKINPVLEQPAYHFLHIMSPHPPYGIFADGSPSPDPMPLIRENYKHEARYTLRMFVDFIEELKTLGLYDDALIILQGDHGVDFQPVIDGKIVELPVGRAPALLAMKLPGKNGPMLTSSVPTMISDLPTSVFEALEMPHNFPGIPFAELGPQPDRPRTFFQHIGHDREDAVLRQFVVKGPVFEPASWTSLGDFEITRENADYQWGDIMEFGMEGNADPFKASGWCAPSSFAQWTDGHRSVLRFVVDQQNEDIVFIIAMRPMIVPGKVDRQRVQVTVNGKELVTIALNDPRPKLHKFVIPAALVDSDEVEIAFGLPDAAIPADLGISGDQRTLGLSIVSVCLFPQSMTEEMANRTFETLPSQAGRGAPPKPKN